MKIRPVVNSHTVTSLLEDQETKLKEAIGTVNSRLEAINKGTIITSVYENDSLIREHASLESDLNEVQSKLTLMKAHGAPRVLVEFEL